MKNRLEEIRKERGIKQEELAAALEVSRQTIGSLENGRYNPSIILAFKLARYFNMSIEDIKSNIDENTYLSDLDKKELLNKLDEILELQKSKDSKTKKWDKAKKILGFILDKGADIAIMYIPQILKAINN